jgi:hypothetical protein
MMPPRMIPRIMAMMMRLYWGVSFMVVGSVGLAGMRQGFYTRFSWVIRRLIRAYGFRSISLMLSSTEFLVMFYERLV